MNFSPLQAHLQNQKFDEHGKRREILEKVDTAVQAMREVGKGSLHEEIEAYCKSKGWYYVHSRTDKASTCGVGTPDFVIVTERGTFWIEAKAKGKKATTEQLAAIVWINRIQPRRATVVWSMQEMVDFISAGANTP